MKSGIIRCLGIASLAAISFYAMAAKPSFTYVRTVDYSLHEYVGNPMAMVAGPNGSSLYFGDWYNDGINYVANPLLTDGEHADIANTVGAYNGTSTNFASNCSYQGAALDGNTLYMSGESSSTITTDPPETVLVAVDVSNPGSWSTTQITGITGAYSGLSVVGPGRIVMANFLTGGLQFFTISGTVATPDGAEIANTNIGTAHVLSVAYDATSGKIFAHIADNNLTRRIDIFNSNGTAAGTSYVGTWAPGVTSTLPLLSMSDSADNLQLQRSAPITVNQKYRILICPNRNETNNGWDLFDISTVGATGTPYKQIRSADLANLTPQTGKDVTGSAMFTDSGNDYFAFFTQNLLSIVQVTDAAVNDWTLY